MVELVWDHMEITFVAEFGLVTQHDSGMQEVFLFFFADNAAKRGVCLKSHGGGGEGCKHELRRSQDKGGAAYYSKTKLKFFLVCW